MQNNQQTIKTQHEVIHARVAGLLKVINRWTVEVDMELAEKQRLSYMTKRISEILEQDKPEHLHPSKREDFWQELPTNSKCEFYDIDQNRIQCAIGCSMYKCSERCGYATNKPGSMPPYKTKYMKGRL